MITPEVAQYLYEQHNEYWGGLRLEMRRLRNAYMMRYWARKDDYDGAILIETSRAYELIESYVASLFVRDPAVVVKPDIRGKGDPSLTQEVANSWLLETRRQIEDALRLSLIYPCAFMKLTPTKSRDVLGRVDISSVGPWEIIVDETASSWETQQFVGHIYYLPLSKAKAKYGAKKYQTRSFSRYIDNIGKQEDSPPKSGDKAPEQVGDFIVVVEFYDLEAEKMFVWSPDYANGEKFLYDGVALNVGTEDDPKEEKYNEIPFRTASEKPVIPIVPIYMSREPDNPMRGYSALRRVYDQVVEVNTVRTFQANGVRKAARQWMTRKGTFDAEAMAKIAQGVDGEFVEVELSEGQDLEKAIRPIPHSPVPPELENYIGQVEQDFSRGSVMAPFTRGQATKATATEVTALAAYTASEIGRQARERDAAISKLAQTYVVMVATLMGDDDTVIRIRGSAHALRAEDLIGNFAYFAQDSGSTPMSDSVRKQEFQLLVPLLRDLGVDPSTILKSLVRSFDLPEDFLPKDDAQPQVAPMAPPAAIPPNEAAAGIIASPSPQNVATVLPAGGVV